MNEKIHTGEQLEQAIGTAELNRKGFQAFNRLGWGLLLFLGAQILLPGAISLLASWLAPDLLNSPFFGIPLVYACMYLIGLPLMMVLLRGIPDHPAGGRESAKKKLSPGALIALYPISYAVLTVFALLGGLVEQLIGKTGTVTTADLVASDTPQWVFFVAGVIIAPVMEEIVFRYLVYKKVSGYGPGVYIFWSATLFGLFHLNFGQSLYAAALGALFAFIVYKTGSVLYTIILHVLVNLTGGIGLGSIVMRSGSSLALTIYSYYTIALLVAGLVLLIVFLARRFFVVKAPAGDAVLPNKKVAFLNPGTLVFCLLCLGLIVLGFFTP